MLPFFKNAITNPWVASIFPKRHSSIACELAGEVLLGRCTYLLAPRCSGLVFLLIHVIFVGFMLRSFLLRLFLSFPFNL